VPVTPVVPVPAAEPVVPDVAPTVPLEFALVEPVVLALVLPVAPRELPVEPVVPVVPIVPVEPELAPDDPAGPVEFGVVTVVLLALGRVPVVLPCPGVEFVVGFVVEVRAFGFVVVDCPTVLPGVVPAVVPAVPV
jgi:hypothetical protein